MLCSTMVLLAESGWAQQTSNDLELNGFCGVEVKGPIDVYVQQSDRFAVRVSGPERLLNRLDLYVKDSTLVVRAKHALRKWYTSSEDAVKLYVQMPTVVMLKASSSADLEATSAIEGQRLLVEAAGSSDVTLHEVRVDVLALRASGASDIDAHKAVVARRVDIDASGASDVEVKKLSATDIRATARGASDVDVAGPSTANRVKLEVSGSSDLSASRLPCQQGIVNASGSSSVSVHVSETLKGSLRGNSDLTVYGPCKTQVSSDSSSSMYRR